jgi:methylenetetrahydrofolate--tRNA-(uracil-5-)-methyltransferase
VLTERLTLKAWPKVFVAGQLSGVEGYTESIATGLLAGMYAAVLAAGGEPELIPRETALGSLVHYICHAEAKRFQPANITFDLLPPLDEATRKKVRDKRERHRLQCEAALRAFDGWLARIGREDPPQALKQAEFLPHPNFRAVEFQGEPR